MKGTVIQRGNRWSVVVDRGRDIDGKRIRKWHSGYPTKREAESDIEQAIHEGHDTIMAFLEDETTSFLTLD